MKEYATFLVGLLVPIGLIFALASQVNLDGARVLTITALIAFVLFWLNRHRGQFANAAGAVAAACLLGSVLVVLQGGDHLLTAIVLLLAAVVLSALGRRTNFAGAAPAARDEELSVSLSEPPARRPLQYELCSECRGVKTVTRLAARPCPACGGTGLVGSDRCPRDCDNGKYWGWETVECPSCLGHGKMLA